MQDALPAAAQPLGPGFPTRQAVLVARDEICHRLGMPLLGQHQCDLVVHDQLKHATAKDRFALPTTAGAQSRRGGRGTPTLGRPAFAQKGASFEEGWAGRTAPAAGRRPWDRPPAAPNAQSSPPRGSAPRSPTPTPPTPFASPTP